MNEVNRRRLLLAGICLLPAAATAQSTPARIWRCGNTYSDHPCGRGGELDLDPAPDARARAEADASTRRIREQADALSHARERSEAAAAQRGPTVIRHSSTQHDKSETHSDKPGRAQRPVNRKGRSPQSDHFTVRVPREDKAEAKVKKRKKKGDRPPTKD